MDVNEVAERFWTDNKAVIGYITNDVRQFETFFANRVQQINDNTISGQWCYIPTRENPGDNASRGQDAAQANSDDCCFQDPPFLWHNMKFWLSRDVNAELPDYNPELNESITSCFKLLYISSCFTWQVWKIELQAGWSWKGSLHWFCFPSLQTLASHCTFWSQRHLDSFFLPIQTVHYF